MPFDVSSQVETTTRPQSPCNGKRKLEIETTAPCSPGTRAIASMMVQVQLQCNRTPKRVRWDKHEMKRVVSHESTVSCSESHQKRLEVKRPQDQSSSTPGENDGKNNKRQKGNEEINASARGTNTRPSDLDSALVLASLALPKGNQLTQKGYQGREDDETDRVIEENCTVRDQFKNSPIFRPVPVSPDTPRRGPTNKKHLMHLPSNMHHPSLSPVHRHRPPFRSMPPPPPPPRHFPPHRMAYPPYGYHHPWNASTSVRCPPSPVYHYPPPPPRPAETSWVCDYCNVARFVTYADACKHEEQCKFRCANGPTPIQQVTSNPSSNQLIHRDDDNTVRHGGHDDEESSKMDEDTRQATVAQEKAKEEEPKEYFTGSIPLYVESTDTEWLSELNCFVRKHCIEAFSATEDDITRNTKRGRIVLNQVGIRCKFCACTSTKDKEVGAVSFPNSVGGVYESVKRFLKVHLDVCKEVPPDMKEKILALQSTSVWVPTTRQYWADSAKALGMVDTPEGIRFERDPKLIETSTAEAPDESKVPPPTKSSSTVITDGEYIVSEEDTVLVPKYVWTLMRQVQMCRFTEADRFVARSRGPIGFAGFQCRHCEGHAGLGKYFPTSPKSLATNSTSQNIHAHMLRCRKCPAELKKELELLKSQKEKGPGLVLGWRKTFFEKVWKRLHG